MRGEVGGVFAEAGEDIAGELGEWFSWVELILDEPLAGPGGLAPDDDGGGGLGPPVVAEAVLEVPFDSSAASLMYSAVGKAILQPVKAKSTGTISHLIVITPSGGP